MLILQLSNSKEKLIILLIVFMLILKIENSKDKKQLLYISQKQFKGLTNNGNNVTIYMGINNKHLYSDMEQSFYIDFMYDEFIYNTYGSFVCTPEISCDLENTGK